MLALINGGAAVAVLTYVGNAQRQNAHIADLMPAIFWYCGGLIATTLAFIVGYVTELKLYNEALTRIEGKAVKTQHQ
jgi:hypothetical protein